MKNKFLNKLKEKERLELVEPSEEICESYSAKSANCLISAKLHYKRVCSGIAK